METPTTTMTPTTSTTLTLPIGYFLLRKKSLKIAEQKSFHSKVAHIKSFSEFSFIDSKAFIDRKCLMSMTISCAKMKRITGW